MSEVNYRNRRFPKERTTKIRELKKRYELNERLTGHTIKYMKPPAPQVHQILLLQHDQRREKRVLAQLFRIRKKGHLAWEYQQHNLIVDKEGKVMEIKVQEMLK